MTSPANDPLAELGEPDAAEAPASRLDLDGDRDGAAARDASAGAAAARDASDGAAAARDASDGAAARDADVDAIADPTGDPTADPDPAATDADPEVREQEAILRRVPRMQVFLALGALVGLVAALILSAIEIPGAGGAGQAQYTSGQVFGFLAVILIPVGIGLFGLLGTLLGRDRGERVRLVKGADDAPVRRDR